jgi:Ca2+-transporting ATPase
MDQHRIQEVLAANEHMSRQALRVLGVACRPLPALPTEPDADALERELTFLGMMGMIDPARPEVKPAVHVARQAGLRSVMVTGDYPETAMAIAQELDLLLPGGRALTGAELDQLEDGQFANLVAEVQVYARVSPSTRSGLWRHGRARAT